MNNNYWDKYSRIHDKPCINGEPSSNNGWIYTAYAKKAGVPVSEYKLKECWRACHKMQVGDRNPILLRSPAKYEPPFSRDEFLGMNYLFAHEMKNYGVFYGWNFSPYELPKFSAVKLAKQLWELRPSALKDKWTHPAFPEFELKFKHRNYFWENNLDQLYRFAFSVPVQDRYFILKTWDKFQWFNPAHLFYLAVAKIDSALPKKSGIKWLKYGGEKNKLAMVEEFPADHPIRIKLSL